MLITRSVVAVSLALGLAACAQTPDYVRNADYAGVTRAELGDTPLVNPGDGIGGSALPSYSVAELNVTVPRSLEVSESNSYYPGGDIVWRGDPFGDRYEQVEAIFRAGMEQGISEVSGARPVIADIVVERFHSLTERARYTVGGVHSIRFTITLRDAETGEVVEPTRTVQADLKAYGGLTALRAEAAGQTQKARVTEHLRQVIIYELTQSRDVQQG